MHYIGSVVDVWAWTFTVVLVVAFVIMVARAVTHDVKEWHRNEWKPRNLHRH